MTAASWRNWTGDEGCTPARMEHPRTAAEIAGAVERAAAAGRTVRVAGSGHSMHDLVATGGVLLSLREMRRVIDVDRDGGLVRVEAGITLHELSELLEGHGLALANLGDIDVQAVAGAIATGTHGSGALLPNISATVEGLEIVTAAGEIRQVDGGDMETLLAARVSLGALGVVSAVTLRCVPAFTLRGVDAPEPLDEILDSLDELNRTHDHFELFTFPHTGAALTMRRDRVEGPPQPRRAAVAWFEDMALTNGGLSAVCRVGRRFPRAIPALNRLTSRLAGTHRKVDASYRVFAAPRLVHFTEMEYAIPAEHAATAVRAVLSRIERERFAVNFPIELRFGAGDDAFLSPAQHRDTAYVAVHMYAGMPWRPYFDAVERIMIELGGRPHWGKRHSQTAATLRERYPDWERFQAVRAAFDPGGRFANPHVRRVLGEPTAAVAPAQPAAGAATG